MMKRQHSYISNIKALVILVLTSLLLIFFDSITGVYLKSLFESSSYNFSRELEKKNADTIILGSSTAARGINPVIFDDVLGTKSYTFAKDGTGIFYATSVLRNLPNATKLRYVIFGIDPDSFVSGFSSTNFAQIERLLPYMHQDELLRSYIKQQISWLELKMLSWSYPYIHVSKEILKDALKGNISAQNGFKPLEGTVAQKKWIEKENKSLSKVNVYNIADESLRALESIRTEVRKRGAKLVLVTLPIFDQKIRSRRDEYSLVMSKIRNVLSGDHLCDLSRLLSKEIKQITVNKKMFYDAAHLNRVGSEHFTTSFATHVQALCP